MFHATSVGVRETINGMENECGMLHNKESWQFGAMLVQHKLVPSRHYQTFANIHNMGTVCVEHEMSCSDPGGSEASCLRLVGSSESAVPRGK